jgi:ClpP class serine protease
MSPYCITTVTQLYSTYVEPHTSIGVITFKDPLYDSSRYIKQLHALFTNPLIKGIIIRIDSSASAPGTSTALFYELLHLKKMYPKPLITVIENVCISGAYLIASTSDYIIAPESACIGGIGGYAQTSQLEYMGETTDPLYQECAQYCIKHIACARKLSLATTSNWAHKKVFTGKQALTIGLITTIGSFHTALQMLKERTLIEHDIILLEYPDHDSPCSMASFEAKIQYPMV